jgi:hypothetical protein
MCVAGVVCVACSRCGESSRCDCDGSNVRTMESCECGVSVILWVAAETAEYGGAAADDTGNGGT